MNNKCKLLGFIAITALITFSLLACGGDDSSDTSSPGNSGGTSSNYITFDLNTGTIVDYNDPGGSVTIPSSVNGTPVVAIGNNAFYDKNLTGINIPYSVVRIGNGAFIRKQASNNRDWTRRDNVIRCF